MWRQLAGFAGGLVYWFVLMVAALCASGGGHGWAAPVLVSLPGFILIPITGLLFMTPSTAKVATQIRRARIASIIMWVVVILDVAAVAITIVQAEDLQQRWPWIIIVVLPWAALWGFWHVIVIKIATERM